MLPVSTALSAPKWFHDFHGPDNVYVDKRGVICGVRAPVLAPINSDCRGPETCSQRYEDCTFLQSYKKQLLSINQEHFLKVLEQLYHELLPDVHEEPVVVFIVHEAPNNPCSERKALQEVFHCEELAYPL